MHGNQRAVNQTVTKAKGNNMRLARLEKEWAEVVLLSPQQMAAKSKPNIGTGGCCDISSEGGCKVGAGLAEQVWRAGHTNNMTYNQRERKERGWCSMRLE